MSIRPDSFRASAPATNRQMGGFLLEAALVMLITGVLTAATFEIHSAMQQRQDSADVKNLIRAVDASIRTFTLREGRLPCPAAEGSPVESRGTGSVGVCSALIGPVPFVTLGMEVPRLSGSQLKYGISPALGSSGTASLDANARQASYATGSTGQAYVAGRDARQLFTNCAAASLNPAYVLMWQPTPGANVPAVPAPCFRENAEETMGLLAVGGLEFLGWLHSGEGR